MHRSVYRRYESGQRETPAWVVVKLADYYHVSTDYLLGRTDGSRYALRWRAEGKDRMVILTRDTARVKVTVTPARRTEDQWWYKTLQVISRGLMMTRTVSVSYTDRFNTTIPGFLPRVGDFFGQNSNAGGLKPGLDFAFGLTGEGYISRAAERGWLQMSDSIINPATTARTQDLQIKATLEPFRYLKVDLSASRNVQKARSIQYMYSGMPTTQTGSFSMTTISIGSAFASLGSVEKAVGILSMATSPAIFCVKQVLDDYFRKSRQRCTTHVVHRLDRDTSGLLVYAKTLEAEQILEHNWREIVTDRRYVALASGVMEQKKGTVQSYLKDNKAYITYSSPTDNGGKLAITHYRVLRSTDIAAGLPAEIEARRKQYEYYRDQLLAFKQKA